jgi:2-oxo-4-hydroxy-4-carboxy-5-ureidoimidazoline decarboxylase
VERRPVLALDEVNALSTAQAVEELGHLFEHSPWIVAETWSRRPFASRADLHRALVATVCAAPIGRQEALIRAHPDLVGQAALAGTLTRASTGEQAAAGLDAGTLTDPEIEAFARNNAAYRQRFGFPFVICARENKKETILAGFAARLHNSREQEIRQALREIGNIAWYRLVDVVAGDDTMVEGALSDGE